MENTNKPELRCRAWPFGVDDVGADGGLVDWEELDVGIGSTIKSGSYNNISKKNTLNQFSILIILIYQDS